MNYTAILLSSVMAVIGVFGTQSIANVSNTAVSNTQQNSSFTASNFRNNVFSADCGEVEITREVTDYHNGVDFVSNGITNSDCAVLAAADGVVEQADWGNEGQGFFVKINYSNGYTAEYFHARELLVGAGDSVSQGTPIMRPGQTGFATNELLHLIVTKNGEVINF